MANKAKAVPGVQTPVLDTLAAAVSAVVSNPVATIAQAESTKPSEVITLVQVDPVVAQFEQFGSDEAIATKAGIARAQQYAALLQGVTFTVWESYRDAWQRGAVAAGYAETAVSMLWNERVAKPLKDTWKITKPASVKSSANRVLSAKAQAKADKRKAHLESICKLSDAALEKRIAKRDDDAATMVDLYKESAARKAVTAKANAKVNSEKEKTMRESIADLLKGMSLPELTKAHTALAGIIAKRK